MRKGTYIFNRIQNTFFVLLLLLLSNSLNGQTLEVPLDIQVPLFLKATTYDRAFTAKLKKDNLLNIGICYQAKNRASAKQMEQLRSELSKEIPGFNIRIIPMAISEGEDISKRFEWPDLSAIYLTSMRGLDLDLLLKMTRKYQVLSISTDPSLSPKGVSMSFELVGSRPKFVINRNSASGEGCDFSSQLLKLATIY